MSSTLSSDTDRRPRTAFTITGKKQMIAAMTTAVNHVRPIASAMTGVIATIGTLWRIMIGGRAVTSKVRERSTAMLNRTAVREPSANPASASNSVIASWLAITLLAPAIAPRIRLGAGSRYGGTLATIVHSS